MISSQFGTLRYPLIILSAYYVYSLVYYVAHYLNSNKKLSQATFTRDQIRSGLFRIGSTMVRIHSVYTVPVRSWDGAVPYGIAFMSGPIWYQMADPIRTGSSRSRVNTRLIRANFVPAANGSGPV